MKHAEGDRVVVTVRRKELAGSITKVGRVGYVVQLDGGDEIHRHEFEVFDQFDDGRKP